MVSPLRLRTQSLISHQPPSFFFPLNLKILGSHLTIFLFFFALSHIMFLPNPYPTEQLIVFPSQSQIFRLPPTIFLFSFVLSHIIFFFPYPYNRTNHTKLLRLTAPYVDRFLPSKSEVWSSIG